MSKRLGITVFQLKPQKSVPLRAQIIMNMASKDKYKSLLERYKQALIKNPKQNLSAYCRLIGVSVSGMHHHITDIGQSVKSIRDVVLKATEHQDCEAFVPFTADSLIFRDVDRADVTIQLPSGTLVSVSHCDAASSRQC